MKTIPGYAERIIVDPEILAGKPVVKGTRVSVELVLRRLALDPDLSRLLEAFPRLTVEDVKASFAYAGAVVEAEELFPAHELSRQTRRTGR